MTAVSAQEKAAVASIGGTNFSFASTWAGLDVRVSYVVEDDGQFVPWDMTLGEFVVPVGPDQFNQWQIDKWADDALADFNDTAVRQNDFARIAQREAA